MKEEILIPILERMIDVFMERFLTEEGVLLDYAGKNGEVILPTPEECAQNKPNALAWVCPIENGGFFNGDLLSAILLCWKKAPSRKLADFARTLLRGLFALQTRSPVPGCILRGLGSDGKCHYPASSNDQVVPFLLGVWEFANSLLATKEEKEECRNRCYTLLKALEKNQWLIPGARPGFERGRLNADSPHSNCHLLLAGMILDELEGGDRVETLLRERAESLAGGYPDITPSNAWYSSHNFYIMRMLAEKVKGRKEEEKLKRSIHITASALLPALELWKKYVPDLAFDHNWRVMNESWVEQKNCQEAEKCVGMQSHLFREISPAYMNEHLHIMLPLSASWIILLSDDEKLRQEAIPRITKILEEIPYEELYCSTFFFGANVIAELL